MTQALLQLVLSEAERHDQQAADRAAARARLAVMLGDCRRPAGALGVCGVMAFGLFLLAMVVIVACGGAGR